MKYLILISSLIYFSLCQNQKNDPFNFNLVVSDSSEQLANAIGVSIRDIVSNLTAQGLMYSMSENETRAEFERNVKKLDESLVSMQDELIFRSNNLIKRIDSSINNVDPIFKTTFENIIKFLKVIITVNDYSPIVNETITSNMSTYMTHKFWDYTRIQLGGVARNLTETNILLAALNNLFLENEPNLSGRTKGIIYDVSRMLTAVSNTYIKYVSLIGGSIVNLLTVQTDVASFPELQCVWAPPCGTFMTYHPELDPMEPQKTGKIAGTAADGNEAIVATGYAACTECKDTANDESNNPGRLNVHSTPPTISMEMYEKEVTGTEYIEYLLDHHSMAWKPTTYTENMPIVEGAITTRNNIQTNMIGRTNITTDEKSYTLIGKVLSSKGFCAAEGTTSVKPTEFEVLVCEN